LLRFAIVLTQFIETRMSSVAYISAAAVEIAAPVACVGLRAYRRPAGILAFIQPQFGPAPPDL
jgi:hypothetical protein